MKNTLSDTETMAAIGGDAASAEELFAVCSACHGEDGRTINFGDEDKPTYVGTIALDNPWEFIHAVRVGQPVTPISSVMVSGLILQDVVDVLTFAQTLPAESL